ncbi:MAG: flagellar hook-length control protein FliK [Rhizobiaceae bacterium]
MTLVKAGKLQDCTFIAHLDKAKGKAEPLASDFLSDPKGYRPGLTEAGFEGPERSAEEKKVPKDRAGPDSKVTREMDVANHGTAFFGAEPAPPATAGLGTISFQLLINCQDGRSARARHTTVGEGDLPAVETAPGTAAHVSGKRETAFPPGMRSRGLGAAASDDARLQTPPVEVTVKFDTSVTDLKVPLWRPHGEAEIAGRDVVASGAQTAGQVATAMVHLIRDTSAGDVKTLRLRLHPAELGQLSIKMQQQGKDLMVTVQAQTETGYSRILAEKDAILRSLDLMGVSVSGIFIQFPSGEPLGGLPFDIVESTGFSFPGGGSGGQQASEQDLFVFAAPDSNTENGSGSGDSCLYI